MLEHIDLASLSIPDKTFALPRNHARNVPQYLMFFDTETNLEPITFNRADGEEVKGNKHSFRLGVCERWDFNGSDYGEKYQSRISTNQIDQFIDFLFAGKNKVERSLWIYCHNLSFDFRIISPYIPDRYRSAIRTFNFDSGKAFVSIKTQRKRDGSIYFVDSHNFFKGSIEQLGELFGLEKEGKEIDFHNVSDDELLGRCKQDVKILRTAMLFLINNFVKDKIRMPITLSSLSFSTYRNDFMNDKIIIHHDPILRQYERMSYHGGRVEIFDTRKLKHVYELDINGMYAYIMKNNSFPVEVEKIIDETDENELSNLIKDGKDLLALANVDSNMFIPLYPYLHNKKLYFPSGNFDTVLTTPEIKLSIDNGEMNNAQHVVVYKSKPIFTDFINYYSKMKEETKAHGNLLMHLFYKLIGNGLYGKFGQQIEEWKPLPDGIDIPEGELVHMGELIKIKNIFERSWYKEGSHDGRYTSPIIASLITSRARCYLWSLLNLSENPIYCDTDAIFLPEHDLHNYERLIHESKLGYLDIELEDIEFQAIAPKFYNYKDNGTWKHKRKGIPRTAKQINHNTFSFTYFLGFHESYNIFSEPVVVDITKQKTLGYKYDKRKISKDGYTLPIPIDEVTFRN